MEKDNSRAHLPLPENALRRYDNDSIELLEQDGSVTNGWKLRSREGDYFDLFRVRTDSEGNPIVNEEGKPVIDQLLMSEKELKNAIAEAKAYREMQDAENDRAHAIETDEHAKELSQERQHLVQFVMGKEEILGKRPDLTYIKKEDK